VIVFIFLILGENYSSNIDSKIFMSPTRREVLQISWIYNKPRNFTLERGKNYFNKQGNSFLVGIQQCIYCNNRPALVFTHMKVNDETIIVENDEEQEKLKICQSK
jgi:hypothetical protein